MMCIEHNWEKEKANSFKEKKNVNYFTLIYSLFKLLDFR